MDKNTKLGIIGALVAILLIAIVAVVSLIDKLTPSQEIMDLTQYYQVPEGEAMVIMDDIVYETNAKVFEGIYYMDLTSITTKFNDRFYFDTNENILVYTTPTEVIKAEVGSKDYMSNKNKVPAGYTIVKRTADEVYVALDFVQQFSNMRFTTYENPNRVIINCEWGEYLYATVKTNTQIRTESSIKSPVLEELKADERVMVIDNGGNEKGYLTVMSEDGVRGYVKKKHLSDSFYDKTDSDYTAPEYTQLKKEYKVNLTWHQVTNDQANANLASMLENTKGITTISPTWYRVSTNDGTLSSLASESYVEKAHSMNIEVWALVDNFDPNVDIHAVLSNTSSRERLVNEIIAQAIKYNLDGINIDFESLATETGPHYIQFLRELSVKCRNNQIVLSSDTYVPYSYNKFYDWKEQGEILDYVIIMGYDEHHSNSEEAGSVSSIDYIQEAIDNTLAMVPADKIIMGVPFYTRLWKEYVELGETKITSEALGMRDVEKILSNNKVTPEWDEKTAQYYAEYTKEGATYKVWIEDEESLDVKLKRIYDANLAGVASWRLGFEKTDVWDVILKYVN